ncbi:MAG: hypothetical protein AMQ22_00610 [Candidatus Methanofastidiosum methylothiophilum]|uniref:Uncharacterized protein n=1 Tax=Candidatus Methanofastidiosum methylothiophilum TaxID=1705564 RepID=A0A150J6F4_9EURY|nr:MAG: hypothetical protein AMQ22_00610 [Candidatus Methanofastidiosum methylthiophilus]
MAKIRVCLYPSPDADNTFILEVAQKGGGRWCANNFDSLYKVDIKQLHIIREQCDRILSEAEG